MFCRKCGNTLPDDAVFCQKCGYRTAEEPAAVTQTEETAPSAPPAAPDAPKPKKRRGGVTTLAVVVSLVLIVGVLAALILPRPDLTMDDFKEEGMVAALFRYGIPTGIDSDYLLYTDTDITFYGVPVAYLNYDFEEREITLRFEGERVGADAAEELIDHCTYEPSESSLVYDFTYESLDISAMPLTDELFVIVIEY